MGGAKFGGWSGNIVGRSMDVGWLKKIDYLSNYLLRDHVNQSINYRPISRKKKLAN